jgi:hypothetical protein
MVPAIRHRHLSQLVQSASSLSGPKLDTALWRRLEPWSAGLPQKPSAGPSVPDELPAETRLEMSRLRGLVAQSLSTMAQKIEQKLGPSLARARQAWEEVDNHDLIDKSFDATLDGVRRQLLAALPAPGPDGGPSSVTEGPDSKPDSKSVQARAALGGVALEGLLALETARALIALAERRMSSLIRLRVQQDEDLLPGGRPFLDLGPAIAEAARAWA